MIIPNVIEKKYGNERVYDLYSKLLEERIILLTGEIDDNLANIIVSELLYLDSVNNKDIQPRHRPRRPHRLHAGRVPDHRRHRRAGEHPCVGHQRKRAGRAPALRPQHGLWGDRPVQRGHQGDDPQVRRKLALCENRQPEGLHDGQVPDHPAALCAGGDRQLHRLCDQLQRSGREPAPRRGPGLRGDRPVQGGHEGHRAEPRLHLALY